MIFILLVDFYSFLKGDYFQETSRQKLSPFYTMINKLQEK